MGQLLALHTQLSCKRYQHPKHTERMIQHLTGLQIGAFIKNPLRQQPSAVLDLQLIYIFSPER